MKTEKKDRLPLRTALFTAGIFAASFGIILCKRCGLGISPVSSIPFVIEPVSSLTFGTLTFLFHLANIALQLVLTCIWFRKKERNSGTPAGGPQKKAEYLRIVLEIIFALAFAWVLDWINALLKTGYSAFSPASIIPQLVMLAGSIFFTALGMALMLQADLIQNPVDGTVKCIQRICGMEMGKVKRIYDISCLVISSVLSILLLGRLKGIGIATIASALLVGPVLNWLLSFPLRGRVY